MSRRTFTLYYVALLALGVAGFLLQIHNPSESRQRDLLGIVLIGAAAVGALVVFRRELRKTDAEKMAKWSKARAKGRRGFVLGQVRGSFPVLLSPVLVIVSESYARGRPLFEGLQAFDFLLWVAPVSVALVALWSLAWWNWQAKKYAGHF